MKIDNNKICKKNKEQEQYPEYSLPRAAYLLSRGHRADDARWFRGKDGKPTLELRFEKTAKLARDVMDYKGGEANSLLDWYIHLTSVASRYRRSVDTLNPIAFSVETVNNNLASYGC